MSPILCNLIQSLFLKSDGFFHWLWQRIRSKTSSSYSCIQILLIVPLCTTWIIDSILNSINTTMLRGKKKKKRLVNVYGSNFVLDFWGKIKGIHLFIFTFHLLWAKFFSPTLRLCSRWIDITLKKINSVGKWNPLPSIYWNWDNNCSVRTSMWYALVICCPQGILCTTCIIISLLIIPRSSFN